MLVVYSQFCVQEVQKLSNQRRRIEDDDDDDDDDDDVDDDVNDDDDDDVDDEESLSVRRQSSVRQHHRQTALMGYDTALPVGNQILKDYITTRITMSSLTPLSRSPVTYYRP